MLLRSLLFLAFLQFTACTSNTESSQTQEEKATVDNDLAAQEALFDEVMVIHDEIMPKMGEINKLRKELRKKLDEGTTPEQAKSYEAAIANLEKAENGMWDWMHALRPLGPLRDSLDHKGVIAHLNAEKQEITQVKEEMKNSIEEGKKLLGNVE